MRFLGQGAEVNVSRLRDKGEGLARFIDVPLPVARSLSTQLINVALNCTPLIG
jgi:hypothetical protein